MMRKKSFFKKLVVVIAFFILILVLSCARKKSENQNQSESLNNQILQALGYIENGEFNYAEKLLQEVKAKDPENCEASYGLALIYLRNLVEIVNSVLSIAFGLGEAFSQSPSLEIQYDNPDFGKSILYNNEIKRLTKKANLSDAIRSILEPAFAETEKIVRNIQIAVSKRCYIRVALPIRLGTERNTLAHFFVGEKGGNLNKWGPTEAAFIGFFANTIDAIFRFIFVINWDINIEKLAEIQFKLNSENLLGFLQQQNPQVQTSIGGLLSQIRPEDLINSAISTDPFDTVAFFASLAYVIDTSPDLLKLQEGSQRILDEVPQHLTVAFDLFVKIFEFITRYSDKDSIIAYQDSTGDGLSTDDFIDLNVFDYPSLQKGLFISAGRSKIKIDKILISTLFRPFLFKETREKYLSAFTKFRDAFDIKNEKIPESQRWINLQYALSLIPFISVQDTIRFNPKKFFEGLKSNPEGLRAILPVWTDITGDGVPEFIIEAEAIGTSEKFCFAPPDRIKSRFIVNPLLGLRGEEISQLRYITIIYSKGEITQDFWCSISPYLIPVAGREYQASISAEMYINNIELNIETKELNFSVLPCDLFAEDEVNFVCYVKEKNKEKMIVRIKDDEGTVNDYELQKVLADNKIYKDFEDKVIRRFTQPATYMGQYIIPSVMLDENKDLYVSWNDIEVKDNDVSSYTIEVLLPETGQIPYTISVEENSYGVKRCVGGICSTKDEDCSGATCLYKIGNVEKFLQGYRRICVRIKGWAVENFILKNVVSSHLKCFEFPQGIINDTPNTIDIFEKEFRTKQATKTTLTFEVKTYARPKNFSLKNPIYIHMEGGIEGRTCLFNPRIVLAVAPFKFTTAEGDKGYIEPYIAPKIFLRTKDFDDDFQDKVIQALAIGDLENFSVENVRYVRKARKYKVFSAFFSQNEKVVPRYFSITEFPLRSLLVLGCASVIPRCFFNSDSAHFPEEVIFRGVSKNLRINKDCAFPEVPWSYYYIAFRDPTFFGSIQVNLDPLKKCDGDPQGWIEPDNYSLNKVTVDLIHRTISPIVSFISSGVGLITGQQQYISTGDFCK
jgi:hypothetical protein